MASIFTYDPNPPRVSSPWSTPQSTTPKLDLAEVRSRSISEHGRLEAFAPQVLTLQDTGITKLDSEPQEGPVEYKLHLLLRPRTSTAASQGIGSLFNPEDSSSVTRRSSPLLDVAMPPLRANSTPSTQTRQNRLQHLTTQLLWRLQQSSPFHSTSSVNLVLPILPEATPKLGVPTRPSQLLPGLEESQGALYEIGVADDGTFVGLTEDEMEESLNNLRAMSASLGCYVEVLRKVVVGSFVETANAAPTSSVGSFERIWVTEALVRPDLSGTRGSALNLNPVEAQAKGRPLVSGDVRQSEIEQIRVSLIGASTSGKSSLLGVLTSSRLDNGRGKTRLGLLKHRHEITSGITSSVAQELVGYTRLNPHASLEGDHRQDIVNYGSTNVESWNDIHAVTGDGRLAFLSDSPGLPRYSKSMLRTIISWRPHWILLCVSASTDHPSAPNGLDAASAPSSWNSSFSYLSLCLKLNLPVIVAVTKMDLATKVALRSILSSVLSLLKGAGRKPIILPSSPLNANGNSDIDMISQSINQADKKDVSRLIGPSSDGIDSSLVPIVLTSSVSGIGLGKLHWLIKSLPLLTISPPGSTDSGISRPIGRTKFHVDETFAMPASRVYSPGTGSTRDDHGLVLCGHVSGGSIAIGDELVLGPFGSAEDAQSAQHLRSATVPSSARFDLWTKVIVVSIRNLRLPVRRLLNGQVGTLGVAVQHEIAGSQTFSGPQYHNLTKARRGMVLTNLDVGEAPLAATSFSAIFARKDFEDPHSPLLLIGGQALVYLNSIRAPIRVTAVENLRGPEEISLAGSLASLHVGDKLPSENEHDGDLFGYEDEATSETSNDPKDEVHFDEEHVRIEFAFLRWPEHFEPGDRVLVIPSPSTSSSINSLISGSGLPFGSLERTSSADFPLLSATAPNSLSGFVGFIE